MKPWDDLTGRHRDITVYGNPVLTSDGVYFDGASCICVNDALTDFAPDVGAFTIEVDVKIDPSAEYRQSILDFIGGQWGWAIRAYASRYDLFFERVPGLGDGSLIAVDSYFDQPHSGWVSLAVSFDPATVTTWLFVNGQVVKTLTDTARYSVWAPRFTIGADGRTTGPVLFFKGWMRNVRITKAVRYAGPYSPAALRTRSDDPFWAWTTFCSRLGVLDIGPHDDLLRRLLPPLAIDRNGVAIAGELAAYGAALDLVAVSADALLAESDPRTTTALLADWERNYGLDAGSSTDAARRTALLAQILSGGGQSRAFYVQLAAALGYTATVIEYTPHTVMSDVTYPLYAGYWRYIWKVRAHALAGAVSAAAFEALIRKIKPAHTQVVFDYY